MRRNAGTKGVPRRERESQILDVASVEFGTLGYAGTSIQSVAIAAGISKPLVYQYFGSKEGLYAACLDQAGAEIGAEIERVARGDAVGIERGIRTLAGMFTVLEPQTHIWRLLHDPTAPNGGPVASTIAAHQDRIEELALEGCTELLALDDNHEPLDISAMTATWLGIVDSLMTWWVEHPEQSADAMLQRCLRLVKAIYSDAARSAFT